MAYRKGDVLGWTTSVIIYPNAFQIFFKIRRNLYYKQRTTDKRYRDYSNPCHSTKINTIKPMILCTTPINHYGITSTSTYTWYQPIIASTTPTTQPTITHNLCNHLKTLLGKNSFLWNNLNFRLQQKYQHLHLK